MSRRRAPQAAWREAVQESTLDPGAKFVALALSIYMNKKGECFPAKETLARDCSLSKRTVDYAILRLERAGFLNVSRSRGRSSNHYRATIPNPARDTGLNPARRGRLINAQPCTERPPTLHGEASNPAPGAPESAESAECVTGQRDRALNAHAARSAASASAPAASSDGFETEAQWRAWAEAVAEEEQERLDGEPAEGDLSTVTESFVEAEPMPARSALGDELPF